MQSISFKHLHHILCMKTLNLSSMASLLSPTSFSRSFLFFTVFLACAIANDIPDRLSFSTTVTNDDPDLVFDEAKETKTHMKFYFHDIVSGPNPTAVRVAQAQTTNSYSTGFGAVVMIDDPLTETPDRSSKLIGRAQGLYALASQEEAGLLMTMNLAFVDGEFNGSSLAVLGRNRVFSPVREMPVVGGSGKFRFARGYVLAKTHEFNPATGDGVVEWNVHVLHRG